MSARAVVIVGPPGAGKSTAGKLAAAELSRPFVDLDEAVGDPTVIFQTAGEPLFRVRELEALEQALKGDVVVAAGAGVVDMPLAIALIEARARVVLLDVNPDVAVERLVRSPRPWLSTPDAYVLREARRRALRDGLAHARVDGNAPLKDVVAALASAILAVGT